jgi:TetR/AcrR family transcriptional regulator
MGLLWQYTPRGYFAEMRNGLTLKVIEQLLGDMQASISTSRQTTDLRQAGLVEAALQLAAQRNPADITTGDLAQAVGISQGAVFKHFPSKQAVWLAVLDWATEQLMQRLRAAVQLRQDSPQGFNPLAALQDVFIAHVDFVVAYPGVPRVVFQELQHAQETALKTSVRGLMQQYRALVMELLLAAKKQQLLAPATDVPAAAVLFLGSVQGLVMQALVSGQVAAMGPQAPGVFSIYLRGITCKEFP